MAELEQKPDTESPDSTDSADDGDVDGQISADQSGIADRISRLLAVARIPQPVIQLLTGNTKRLAVSVSSLVLLTIGVIWSTGGEDGPEPKEMLQEALRLLDVREDISSREQSREIARELLRIDYRDTEFPGAVEFILGIAAFRDAESLEAYAQERHYLTAIRYLRAAAERTLDASRRPEWAYALGVSLHQTGAATEAKPRLEEAVKTYPAGRTQASIRLVDVYLDLKSKKFLKQALDLSSQIINTKPLLSLQRDRAYLQRAQIFLALKRNVEAEQALSKISEATSSNQGTIVFRAQTLMADGDFQAALKILGPVANDLGLERTFSRQASFLMGVCAEKLGDLDAAVNYYERTAQRYNKSHEGLAANLRAGDLLRKTVPVARNEEALKAYRNALQMVRSPEDFRNRWLSLERFRETIIDAWNSWVDSGNFDKSIELTRSMTPLLPDVQAYELGARANQRWAESLEAELLKSPFSERAKKSEELRNRWRESGRAYADLARSLRTSSKYPDALWQSAEHYRNGHDFQRALNQLTRFINTQPRSLLPLAFVRRGEVLLDLDRLDEALEHFKRVIETAPTDEAVFKAKHLLGTCYLEKNELDKAEQTWRDILTSELLTPDAPEWRQALFSLGRLLYQTADMLNARVMALTNASENEDSKEQQDDPFQRWDESIQRLEEYLKRYPNSPESTEARYLLARALQRSAEQPQKKLKTAETENARLEFQRTMRIALENAIVEFRRLQTDLIQAVEKDQLNSFGEHVLRDCYFEIAHTYYALEDYEKAIVAYGSSSNRYPQDPRVLLAYVQMTNCYDRLGKPDEAHSMLQQAFVILKGMPDGSFQSRSTNMSRDEWKQWLEWSRKLHRAAEKHDVTQPSA